MQSRFARISYTPKLHFCPLFIKPDDALKINTSDSFCVFSQPRRLPTGRTESIRGPKERISKRSRHFSAFSTIEDPDYFFNLS
jgi:hypothetical protein